MSVNQPGDVAYGFSQALLGVPSKPILAQRSPTTNDKAQIGTMWINQVANTVFFLTSIVDNVATWVESDSTGSIQEIITDSGLVFPSTGVINLFGGANINTSGSGNTATVSLDNDINLPATNAGGTQGVYKIGGADFLFGYGPTNTFVGGSAGNTTLTVGSALDNTGVGNNSLGSLTTGDHNTAVGAQSLTNDTTGFDNVAVGYLSLTALTTGESNTAVGTNSLENLVSGTENIAIGFGAGSALNGAQTSNIYIGSAGNVADDNTIRIGTQGSGAGEQDSCFIAGIAGVTVGGTPNFVTIDTTTGKMGSTASTGTVTTIDGDTGSATGTTITFTGLQSGGSVNFSASGATVTMNFTKASTHNTFLGNLAGNTTATGVDNTSVGYQALHALVGGIQNTAVGFDSLALNDNGNYNTAIGYGTLSSNVGLKNTALGNGSLGSSTTGDDNTALGYFAGSAYTGGETNNICIGANVSGTALEDNTIHIGDIATITSCFIAGIGGVAPGGTPQTVIIDPVTGKLGSTASGGGGVTTIDGDTGSATGATITFNGLTNAGSSVSFVASGATVDLHTSDASQNTLVGFNSGNGSLSGDTNTGLGYATLHSLTSGGSNTAVGAGALNAVTTGDDNNAVGEGSQAFLTTGSMNDSLGTGTLPLLLTGSHNIAIGWESGANYTSSESSNILIGNAGVVAESNVIRIGTSGQQDSCFISGIAGVTVASSATVLIDTATGQLGTIASSKRYKENIIDIDTASSPILNMRPVRFNYKNDSSRENHYGLIAEEVDQLLPDLVVYNRDGEPETVRYHEMPALLLNELQRQHAIIVELSRRLERLETRGSYESKA